MGITVSHSGRIGTVVWDEQASKELGRLAADLIKERTSQGRGDRDQAHKPYSTEPVKMYYRLNAARRLKPKGGVPFNWVRGPRRIDGTYDASKIGQEGGRFYEGGYADFKRSSRVGIGNEVGAGTEVDLTLSGQMLRQFAVLRHTRLSVVIGLKGNGRKYGPFVDAARPWIGISPANAREIDADLPRMIAGAEKRAGGGNVAS